MGKQVIIKRLALVNFKGLRNVAIDFSGGVTTISGRNGTGKTTVIDAFNWLLFGKDSEGNSDQKFGIKTNDRNGAFIPHLDHEVSAVFEVTDTETGELKEKTFRRVLVEEWKEEVNAETGETSEYLKGHHTNYYYNEMPLKTKTEYDRIIADLIPEAVFKVITNPSYFLTLHWQAQRDMLLQMAGEITDEQIITSDQRFNKLLELLQGKTLEGYQAMIKEDRAKIEADLQRIPTRIDEVTRNTPQSLDFTDLESQLKQLQEEYNGIDKAMSSVAEANRQTYERKNGLQRQINDLQFKQQGILFEAKKEAQEKANEINQAYYAAVREIERAETNKRNYTQVFEADKRGYMAQIERAKQDAQQLTKQQSDLRDEWYKVNEEEFKPGEKLFCPLFKHACADQKALQQFHEDQTAARATFYEDREDRLNRITEKGKQLGGSIKAANDLEKYNAERLAEAEQKYSDSMAEEERALEAAKQKREANKLTQPAEVKGEDLPEWVGLQQQIDALRKELQEDAGNNTGSSEETNQLRQKRAGLQERMDAIKADLQKREHIEKANARIAELNQQKKELQKAKAQLQGKEDLVADFERAKMEEVERRVNALFSYVQFKMYRQQIEDAKQVPDCVCYIDGVRYTDKNAAGKVNAGLDVINTLCDFHKAYAPIFIDNAEGVNEFIPVTSQLIKLEVTKGDFMVTNF